MSIERIPVHARPAPPSFEVAALPALRIAREFWMRSYALLFDETTPLAIRRAGHLVGRLVAPARAMARNDLAVDLEALAAFLASTAQAASKSFKPKPHLSAALRAHDSSRQTVDAWLADTGAWLPAVHAWAPAAPSSPRRSESAARGLWRLYDAEDGERRLGLARRLADLVKERSELHQVFQVAANDTPDDAHAFLMSDWRIVIEACLEVEDERAASGSQARSGAEVHRRGQRRQRERGRGRSLF